MIAYLDHPIGEENGHSNVERGDNLANAGEWFCFLVEITAWAVIAPWYVYAVKGVRAPRRIVDAAQTLERTDLYVMTGGVVAPHMHVNLRHARRLGVPVLDLTSEGVIPPAATEDVAQVIAARARRAILKSPRRVWLPLLLESDLAALKKLAHAARVHMPEEHDTAASTVDRIITAAEATVP